MHMLKNILLARFPAGVRLSGVLLSGILLLAGCREFTVEPDPSQIDEGGRTFDVPLDEFFEIRPGDVVGLDSTLRSLEFRGLIEESRCPTGATCETPGRASILLILSSQQDDAEYQLLASVQGNLDGTRDSDDDNVNRSGSIRFDGLVFTLLTLEPYPELGVPIRAERYVATMRVEQR
ncbi:MAG: hypothetical protein COV99_06320 [Bacteroidetes bacterium CG12_big_fil_rev_8_21_14_0_65_60_17]|nr:MAG: hypothetical protein COV99_06320 [Bacteroidetes bacterium CG12_big_fil_rev_8_21_14_0_65_60_17]